MHAIAQELSSSINNTILSSDEGDFFNQDMISKMREVERFFKKHVRYVVDFNNFPVNNITQLSLGGRDPLKLGWTLDVEPFSQFSYAMMRQNVLSLCTDDRYYAIRQSIVYMKE